MKAINNKIKALAKETKVVKTNEIYQNFNNKDIDYQKVLNSRFQYKPVNDIQRVKEIKKVIIF
jgi:hypothetical protein